MSDQTREFVQRPLNNDLPDQLSHLHPVLRRIYAARGVAATEDLDLGLARLHSFSSLKGIDLAAGILSAAVTDADSILIVGDFDADGATSCALAMRALSAMGAAQVDYLVPNRFEFGYGLTPEIVAIAQQQQPDLIITVDNGISSIDGVEKAREAGIKVIITDHHLAGRVLPRADAIVNPNQPGCEFPSKNLAGVGVIFYLLCALRKVLRESGWFSRQDIAEPNLAQFLDLVALGTVADVVPLDSNNRILVHQGLARIRAGQATPGINALLEVAKRSRHKLVAGDLGFAVGPRLNAAGRLQDMSVGIECLLSENPASALELAYRLDALNRERRDIEAEMKDQALSELQKVDVDAGQVGLCLYNPAWHQGVVGILAARIKERFHRPVIAFADADGDEIKGSARSIPGFHIRDALDAIATANPELLSKFGGHAMAAGLSLKKQDYSRFAEAFNRQASAVIATEDLAATVTTDGELAAADFTLALADTLSEAGPWGQAFPEPLFVGTFRILEQRVVGEKHIKMRLMNGEAGKVLDAIAFFVDLEQWPNKAPAVRMAFKLEANEFRGNRSVQLVADYIEPMFGG